MRKNGKIIVKCLYCGCDVEKFKSQLRKQSFCCKEHYNLWMSENQIGDKNPNYGKKWTEEQKKRQSKIVSEKMDEEACWKAGSANRGKKFSKERIKKMHENRTFESYSHPHSKDSKEKIGIKSKAKFTPEYKKRYRKVMEDKGIWVKKSDKSDFEIYKFEANWQERMWDKITDEKQLKLLKEKKVFNSCNNTQGVVRDHKYGRYSGFKNKVFPEILRHPCNCEIITHSKNVSKRIGRYVDANSISLNELFELIINYTGYWNEQETVLQKIKEYKEGKRWERKE